MNIQRIRRTVAVVIAAIALAAGAVAPARAAGLDAATQQALVEAIKDEYQARALYQAVIAKFGQVRPFVNIVRAEENHITELKVLFSAYDIPVPPDPYAGAIHAPVTIQEACRISAQAEIDNGAIYERLLKTVKEPDIVATFTRLRDASLRAHLPAFQRCR
jgi:soluble lytic murein transglycosylase-like protein